MCGICGQYNFGDSAPVQRRDIEAMTKSHHSSRSG